MGGALPFAPEEARVVIETPRLLLEPLAGADADELFELLNDAELHRFTGGTPLSRSELTERYELLEGGSSPDGEEIWANWTVRLRQGRTAVGTVQATVGSGDAALAWVIGTEWQGQGYAGEASAALGGWLHASGVHRLTARIHPDHAASAAVARRVGLQPTGRLDADGEELWESAAA